MPIAVDAATEKRAREVLDELTRGRIDRGAFSDELDAMLPKDWDISVAVEHAAALGPAKDMYAFQQRVTAEGVATYFRVRYPSEIMTWILSVDDAGRIIGFALRRSPRNMIFNVWIRDVAY
ncbi:MAG: hypothetical protein IAI50_18120 [Candidatus Eremiobacteraeota bacterium]|nr:hypothetical protein [Candidatus Eremiobacteraeota bacterium]